MNLEAMKDLATSKFARQVLVTQKHSPKILFVAGVVGVVGTVVLACRATLNVAEVLDHHEIDAKLIKGEYPATQLADENVEKSLRKLKVKTGLEIAKLYAPAVGVGVLAVGALTGSHVVLSKRNTAVMAAYAGLDRAYKEYRQRVVAEYGQDADHKFVIGAERVHVEEKTADGKTKITTKDVVKKDSPFKGASPYAVLFDENTAPHKFTREPGMNAMLLGVQQQHATDRLRGRGHLFLNEVHDMLGLPRTKAGAVVGWVYRNDSEEKTGDNYVSFGISEGDWERGDAFVNGEELSVWLDFNVDGVILDLI
jgi:hypothetical protein